MEPSYESEQKNFMNRKDASTTLYRSNVSYVSISQLQYATWSEYHRLTVVSNATNICFSGSENPRHQWRCYIVSGSNDIWWYQSESKSASN